MPTPPSLTDQHGPAEPEGGHGHASGGHHHSSDDMRKLASREFWDERYASADAIWSGQPNQRLIEQVSDEAPGAALDVGSGEGADAIWLAQRGWQVTGVDISTVALSRAAGHAAAAGPQVAERIDWQQADLLTWEPPRAAFDLVSAQFMHLPRAEMAGLQQRLAAAVRPRGILLIVGHDESDREVLPRPHGPELYYGAAELAAALDDADWEVLVADRPERQAVDPEGRTVTIRDAVLRARRR